MDVQVKKVSPWGIPAKGPFLGSVPGSHGSTVATLSGLQLATLSSVPVSTLMPSGSGATVGQARVGPSALQFGMEPTPVFGEVWGDLKSDIKNPPCNNTWWQEDKKTVQSPPLCLRRERRLRRSPTVVAGSSMDHHCTGTKGTASDVRRTTGGMPRHQPHATMRGVHPRSPEGPGASAYFRRCKAMNSRKTCTRKR